MHTCVQVYICILVHTYEVFHLHGVPHSLLLLVACIAKLSILLRIATLSDHQFIFNHLLRCPPGVGRWGAKYLQISSPLHTDLYLAPFKHRGVCVCVCVCVCMYTYTCTCVCVCFIVSKGRGSGGGVFTHPHTFTAVGSICLLEGIPSTKKKNVGV